MVIIDNVNNWQYEQVIQYYEYCDMLEIKKTSTFCRVVDSLTEFPMNIYCIFSFAVIKYTFHNHRLMILSHDITKQQVGTSYYSNQYLHHQEPSYNS